MRRRLIVTLFLWLSLWLSFIGLPLNSYLYSEYEAFYSNNLFLISLFFLSLYLPPLSPFSPSFFPSPSLYYIDIDSGSTPSEGAVGGHDISATPTNELTALSPPTKSPAKRNRCHMCRKKIGLTGESRDKIYCYKWSIHVHVCMIVL